MPDFSTKFRNRILYSQILLSIFLVTCAASASNSILKGYVTKVRDGDTLEVGKTPIRLAGISAPELNEPHGPESKAFLTNLVLRKNIECELNGTRSHDRFVGRCFFQSVDIGKLMVKAGFAIDCPRYSKGYYQKYENTNTKTQIVLPKYCEDR